MLESNSLFASPARSIFSKSRLWEGSSSGGCRDSSGASQVGPRLPLGSYLLSCERIQLPGRGRREPEAVKGILGGSRMLELLLGHELLVAAGHP